MSVVIKALIATFVSLAVTLSSAAMAMSAGEPFASAAKGLAAHGIAKHSEQAIAAAKRDARAAVTKPSFMNANRSADVYYIAVLKQGMNRSAK